MESVYGHRIVSLEDEFIFLVDIFMEGLATTGPAGGALVDFIPLCECIYLGDCSQADQWRSEVCTGMDAGYGLETLCAIPKRSIS